MVTVKLDPQAEEDLKVMAANLDMTQAEFVETALMFIDENWDAFVESIPDEDEEDEDEDED